MTGIYLYDVVMSTQDKNAQCTCRWNYIFLARLDCMMCAHLTLTLSCKMVLVNCVCSTGQRKGGVQNVGAKILKILFYHYVDPI